jgi:hypothetical protein
MSTAITYSRYGGPDVLSLTESQAPRPGPGQVRIRVRAIGVNPIDALGLKAGQTLLILGAGGSVGTIAVQLAVARGDHATDVALACSNAQSMLPAGARGGGIGKQLIDTPVGYSAVNSRDHVNVCELWRLSDDFGRRSGRSGSRTGSSEASAVTIGSEC